VRKRSVLILGNFLSATGGSRGVCEELAERLPQAGWQVLSASRRRPKFLRLADMVFTAINQRRHYGVAQVDVFSGPAFLWAEMVAGTLRSLRKPFVLSLHGGNLPAFSARWPKRVQRLLASARVVTAPSAYLKEKLAALHPAVRIIPNPIDLGRYPFRARAPVRPRLIWVRAFHELYNPRLVVRTLALLAPGCPALRAEMVGPDKGDSSLQRTQAEATAVGMVDRLQFTGQVPKSEVPRLLATADVFLNTSNVDNTPVSVVEAMACGLCVVSTRVGGMPYLCQDGANALLVAPDDPPAMASAVRRLFEDSALSRTLSQGARLTASASDSPQVIEAWDQLLGSLLDSKDRPA